MPPSDELSSSLDLMTSGLWLPGPIDVTARSSTEPRSGWISLAGLVSRRVARVVFDDGAGHVTPARVGHGTFAVVGGTSVRSGKGKLVSYDHAGKEIDRRSVFGDESACYVDPGGNVVHGSPAADCQPAEPWQLSR